jgi:hypothetical protein
VAGPEDDDALHDAGGGAQQRERVRRDRARVDVARVRHDQRFREPRHERRLARLLQHAEDVAGELDLVARVEQAGDGGRANGAHDQ